MYNEINIVLNFSSITTQPNMPQNMVSQCTIQLI